MPQPRKALVSLEATPYYHCISRCVRRAFLCGKDAVTGQSFEHRRQWIEDRILALSQLFAIDICAYAVMSNHYHVVLHVNKPRAESWSTMDVIVQWHALFKGSLLSQRYRRGDTLMPVELDALNSQISLWRQRLMDISWFMRVLNEGVARQANTEDHCSGRFWEGRFKSQALLDEKALIACMAYVDLNPIRAKLATTPEDSAYTAIKRRAEKAQQAKQPNHSQQQAANLLPFAGNPRDPMPDGLPFRLTDYMALVDWTGRILREDKRGAIPSDLPPMLQRLAMDPKHWCYLSQHFESRGKSLVGSAYRIKAACQHLGKQWTHGIKDAEQMFSSS